MEIKDCKLCGGDGLIPVDDLTTRQCVCLLARAMLSHLGPEIGRAHALKSTPLYVRSEAPGTPPEFDGATQNLFLKAPWPYLLPHFKYVLMIKGLNFTTRITTDEKLLAIWLGKESYGQKQRNRREDEATYNGLADFVRDPHLLIIRLGFLGYKNQAAPGVLKEALMHREVQRKPTWLIENPENTFIPGNYSYSDDVMSYIASHFSINLDLTPVETEAPAQPPTWTAVPTPKEAARPTVAEDTGMEVEDVELDGLMSSKPKYGGGKKPSASSGGGKWKGPKKPSMDEDFEK